MEAQLNTLSEHVIAQMGALPEWGIVLISLVLAVLVAVFIHRVLWHGLDHAILAEQVVLRQIMKRIRPLVRYAFVLLAIALIAPDLPMPDRLADTLNRLMMAAFTILVGWSVILASNIAIERYTLRFDLTSENNLMARKMITQMRVMRRTIDVAVGVITLALALMHFETVRQYGVSLFASAGIAGLAIGLSAKPLLENLIAGVQLAITQPIRIDDVVIVEGEWGRVESFTATFVVICIWDQRRLIVPLSYFLSKPFQNWTHTSADLLGTVFLYTDYTVPVAAIREQFSEVVKTSALWDGRVAGVQVTNTTDRSVEVRCLMSARDSSALWDLRCEMREKMLDWLQRTYPAALPRLRAEMLSRPQ